MTEAAALDVPGAEIVAGAVTELQLEPVADSVAVALGVPVLLPRPLAEGDVDAKEVALLLADKDALAVLVGSEDTVPVPDVEGRELGVRVADVVPVAVLLEVEEAVPVAVADAVDEADETAAVCCSVSTSRKRSCELTGFSSQHQPSMVADTR